ncbi:hypothetical protein Goari_019069, partial [Gossypium aridum]|nr:hypothetical protein [Gossypium aridum]
VHWQQESLQRKFNARKGTLEKKLASLETWRRVSLAFFVVAFFSLLIFSVVAATKSVKHVITALGSALTVAIVPVGTWCNERWNRNKEKEKKKLKLTKTVFYAALTPIIRVLVDQLEVKFKSLSHSVDSVLTEGYALKVAMDKIKNDLKDVTDTIPDVLRRANDLDREIMMDWQEILKRMMDTLDKLAVGSDLDSLTKKYIDNIEKNLELRTAIDDCLRHTRSNHEIIRSAVKCFREDFRLEVRTDEKKFVKDLVGTEEVQSSRKAFP